ncbi:homocysteine S-methyltransferase family protein [bacterium]|nr:homocysteine S-methyltransferase family protein [bacterium]
MRASWLIKLAGGHIFVGDGAMGTRLQEMGFPVDEPCEQAVLSRPDLVLAVHHEYYDAGADISTTNTFGIERMRPRIADQVADLNRNAAKLARAVCPAGRLVAGSIGPIGERLEPFGPVRLDEARAMFTQQAEALAGGGVDLLLIETMTSADEAELAIRAAHATGLPVAATMTFQRSIGGTHTPDGVSIEEAVERLGAAGADIIGANCGTGHAEMVEVVRRMRALTQLPLMAQASAGIPEMINGRPVWPETPQKIVDHVKSMLESGVSFIGGCCGTGPEHIRVIRSIVDQHLWASRLTSI